MKHMKQKVYSLLCTVPKGFATTYRDLARASKTHPRAVAMYMKHNDNPKKIPCFKVVKSDRTIGGYSSKKGVKEKISLLKKDGIKIEMGKVSKSSIWNFTS